VRGKERIVMMNTRRFERNRLRSSTRKHQRGHEGVIRGPLAWRLEHCWDRERTGFFDAVDSLVTSDPIKACHQNTARTEMACTQRVFSRKQCQTGSIARGPVQPPTFGPRIDMMNSQRLGTTGHACGEAAGAITARAAVFVEPWRANLNRIQTWRKSSF
jgi:hypothetical protein